jgi:hypothetical protein
LNDVMVVVTPMLPTVKAAALDQLNGAISIRGLVERSACGTADGQTRVGAYSNAQSRVADTAKRWPPLCKAGRRQASHVYGLVVATDI